MDTPHRRPTPADENANPPNPFQAPRSHPSTRAGYLTAPPATDKMPGGIPFIVGNEAAERFSYYGMRGILVIFMTQYLLGRDGQLAVMDEEKAKSCYHLFLSAVYFFPLFGALLSEIFLGKYRTIVSLSLVYCLGHLALALDETRLGLFTGLALIAIGSGGIKPCVSAHLGDQFGQGNQHLLEKVFGWFYFAINFGAFFSSMITPWLLDEFGPGWAFGVPGVLMALATFVFWMGRKRFVHVPAGGAGFIKEAVSGEGLQAVLKLSLLYAFVAIFWSLYDQSGSAWVLQAEKMDRSFSLEWLQSLGVSRIWLPGGWRDVSQPFTVLASQVQTINPLLIMIYMPLFAYVVYPLLERIVPLSPLRKIGMGFFLTVVSFGVSAGIEHAMVSGRTLHVGWQLLAFALLTAAEVMVSITVLEFSYTQAPKKMKSFIMAINLLSVSLGNMFTSLVNWAIGNVDGSSKLAGASYYWFFAGVMLAAALIFIAVARNYQEKTYIQDEA